MHMFVDGVLASTSDATLAIEDTPFSFRIGNSNSDRNPFQGAIDEVAIYRVALDASTVAAHYTAAAGEVTATPIATPVPPTSTPVPPTATPVPTNTPLPPTNTPVPPTATPVPPTATPVPPTATPVPPTHTPIPPTSTPVPPTSTPVPTSAPVLATPAREEPASTPGATPAIATPAIAEIMPLTEYVDPEANLGVGYPADWRRLTEEEIRAQLGDADESAVEAALTSTRFVVVSPEGRAAISFARHPRSAEEESLDDVVQAVLEANAASISGIEEITTEPVVLDGVNAVRISFTTDDPEIGTAGKRLIRQLVAVSDDSTVVLTFILQTDSVAEFEDTIRQIEESWRWRQQP
jgi:hypothetical protein